MRGVSSLQSPGMTSICFYRTRGQARAKYLDMFLVSAAEPDQHPRPGGRRDLIIQDPAGAGRGGHRDTRSSSSIEFLNWHR